MSPYDTFSSDFLQFSFGLYWITMQPTDGLVQRRNVKQSQDFVAADESKVDKDVKETGSESDDESDKTTRLTLMEEVLLLGLKDREVIAVVSNIFFLLNVTLDYFRVILLFGMIAFRLDSVVA